MPAIQPLYYPFVDNETPGDRVGRILEDLDGVSLVHLPEKLIALAAVDEDHPQAEAMRTTNCASSQRWLWAVAGCPHPKCHMPDEQIRALDPAGPVSWDLTIAREMGALVVVKGWRVTGDGFLVIIDENGKERPFGRGWGAHYATPGWNNDHQETGLARPDKNGIAKHGGGGRAQNAITVGVGDIRMSLGRSMLHAIDVDLLQIPTVRPAPGPDGVASITAIDGAGAMDVEAIRDAGESGTGGAA